MNDLAVKKNANDLKTFAERFKFALTLSNENIPSLSKKTGIADSALRKYEKGSMPSLDNAILIADALGVSLDWLAKGEGNPMKTALNKEGEIIKNIEKTVETLSRYVMIQGIDFSPIDMGKASGLLYKMVSSNIVIDEEDLERLVSINFVKK